LLFEVEPVCSLGSEHFFAADRKAHDISRPPAALRPDFDAIQAGVAELVDALDLGSSDESCGGSSPSARTKRLQRLQKNERMNRVPDGIGSSDHKDNVLIWADGPAQAEED
jgi:hypothetical protein